jgi:hypothetical protein
MTAGPMTITPVYCGTFSAAQQQQFGTTATGGFIYKFSNASNLTAAPKVDVDFTSGSTVDGENVTGDITPVGPGQSATGEVDAVGGSGSDLTFSGCEILSYALVENGSVDPVSYAG